MTKAEATRETGLLPKAISVIFNALEDEGFALRNEPLRGRIDQPSTPMRLNPDARFQIGLKIGRRGFDLVVVDFIGAVRARRERALDTPTPERTVAFLREVLDGLLEDDKLTRAAVLASGITIPSQLWHWSGDFGASRDHLEVWRGHDIGATLSDLLPGPVHVENDGTAACYAEWVFGANRVKPDSLYLFVGTFIRGGVILDGVSFAAVGEMQARWVPCVSRTSRAERGRLILRRCRYFIDVGAAGLCRNRSATVRSRLEFA